MDNRAQPQPIEDLKAAFDWWREAGVDCEFSDEPTNWLAAKPAQPEPQIKRSTARGPEQQASPEAAPSIAIVRGALPQVLSDFSNWWLTAPELDAGRTSGRIAPRGNKNAELMVLVPEPEREDRDQLLSGPQGKLLQAMLQAMGCDADKVYFASTLPRHMPGADWQALADLGIGEVLMHHIALVSPKRLIAFGGNILPFFGNNLPQDPAVLREINLEGQCIPLLAARSLPALLERPRWKGDLWKNWLEWTDQVQAG
ncbi:MAG: uracil-DNA glycosylase family protein [Novosphingobium sp.]|nr:uracil-DNA glycosylase family protein [Novosphingobium sp.]